MTNSNSIRDPHEREHWVLAVLIAAVFALLIWATLNELDRTSLAAKSLLKFAPDANTVQPADDFLIGTPDRTRCPRWVLERLDADSLVDDSRRGDETWFEDSRLPIESRAILKDYERSGFDRGHLAPAQDHARTEATQQTTFTLANAMPQNSTLNRGLWNQLEQRIRQRAKQPGTTAYVLTMPVWQQQHNTDGTGWVFAKTIGRGVWVPTHCAKAVLWFSGDKIESLDCWLLPNVEPDDDAKLERFRVKGDTLEAVTGLDLFPGVPDDIEERLESSL